MTLPWRMWTYVGWMSLRNILICVAAMAMAIVLIDLIEQMRAAQEMDGGGFGLALLFVGLRLPGLLEQTLAFAVLVGIVMTFVGLSRYAELIALRAAGYSAWQFVLPAGVVAALIGLVAVFVLGPAGAGMAERYDAIKNARTTATQAVQAGTEIVWKTLPLGNGVALLSGEPDPASNDRLIGPTALVLPNQGSITRIDAASAVRTGQSWTFSQARINITGQAEQQYPSWALEGSEGNGDDTATELSGEPRVIPIWNLPAAASFAASRGGSMDRYWVRFHRQLAFPLLLVAVTIVGALLSMGLDRAGNRAQLIATAIGAGVSIQLLAEVAGGLATAGIAPAWSAAWTPPLLGLLLGLAILSLREDG